MLERTRSVTVLDAEAVAIGELVKKARSSLIDSVRYAIEAGHRLAAKKASLDHGDWLPWLEANAEVLGFETDRSARLLMAAWKRWRQRYGSEAEAMRKLASDLNDADQARQISRDIYGHGNTYRTIGTGNVEWYTPDSCMAMARNALGGGIDLDPTSCAEANRTVKARRYYTKSDDGLSKPWRGKVWLNPPYQRQLLDKFVSKLVAEYRAGHVTEAILLTHAFTDCEWFHVAAAAATAICFTKGRIAFVDANGKSVSPAWGQIFFYFGNNVERFSSCFADTGLVTLPAPIQRRRITRHA
jgi:hypothetical protein